MTFQNDIGGLLFDVALSVLFLAIVLGCVMYAVEWRAPAVSTPRGHTAQQLTSSRIFLIYTCAVCAAFVYNLCGEKIISFCTESNAVDAGAKFFAALITTVLGMFVYQRIQLVLHAYELSTRH